MAEPDFDIDAASEQFDAARADNAPGEPDPALDPAKIEVHEDELDEQVPGHQSYDDYIANGGDPDRYVGKKAFADNYDRIQDNKRLRGDIKTLQGTVQQTMDAVNTWQGEQRKQIRTELEAELHTAKEAEDIDAALDAQHKLDQHDATPAPTQEDQPRQENPIIQDFRGQNPLLNHEADDFNEEFNADVELLYNETAAVLSQNGKRALTDNQIKRALNKALKDAKDLHADLFESPRNNRRNPGGNNRQQRRTQQKAETPTAEGFVIDNPKNPSQGNAATQIRETIRDAAVKQAEKVGKSPEDAKKAGDLAASNFEKGLHR